MSLSKSNGPVLWSVDERGVASVVLNRPEVNNAYDGDLVRGLLEAIDRLSGAVGLRAIILKGNGRHFQAGADLNWLDAVAKSSPADNVSASRATAEAVQRLNLTPVPTLALVQGGCFGGGTGIIAACDVVIAADNAMFSIAEVRWGLTAAIIMPQLNDAIGLRQLRRYALTGERFRGAGGATHRSCPRGGAAPGARSSLRTHRRPFPRERPCSHCRDQGGGARCGGSAPRPGHLRPPGREPLRQKAIARGSGRASLVLREARSPVGWPLQLAEPCWISDSTQ